VAQPHMTNQTLWLERINRLSGPVSYIRQMLDHISKSGYVAQVVEAYSGVLMVAGSIPAPAVVFFREFD
jgi:hypothetical protein